MFPFNELFPFSKLFPKSIVSGVWGMASIEDLAKELKSIPESAVKDPRVFSFEYVPERIYMRKELRPVLDVVKSYIAYGVPEHIIIYGFKGSGKTVSLKAVLEAVKLANPDILCIYVNARSASTEYKLYKAIVGGGVSIPMAKERMLEILRNRKAIIVIDDIDTLTTAQPLFVLSRETNALLLMMSTTNIYWFENLVDPSTKSSLSPKEIYFSPYKSEEIREILRMRAEEGLKYWEDYILDYIANIVAGQFQGDVRIAIRALFHIARMNKWNIETAKEAITIAISEIERHTINSLADLDIFILYILSKTRKTSEAYKLLKETATKMFGAESGFAKISKKTFFRSISYLQSLGLMLLIKARANRGRYTYEVELIADRQTIEKTFEERFQQYLENIPQETKNGNKKIEQEKPKNQSEARKRHAGENATSSIYSWRDFFKLALNPPGIILLPEDPRYITDRHIAEAIAELRRLAGTFEKARIVAGGEVFEVPAENLEAELKRIIQQLKSKH